jgi:nucleotide-binding universal stress UspA family protein
MFSRVLLPLDGSAMAEQALPYAIAQAERFRAELVLLQAVEPILDTRSQAALEDARPQRMEWARDHL